MPVAITLHILSAVVWVGGMFFAWMALRPVAASLLEPPLRLPLWSKTFARFFPWVWTAVILLPASGYWMIFEVFEGMHNAGLYIHVMQVIGVIMIMIFLHLFFVPYRRMNRRSLPAISRRGKTSGCHTKTHRRQSHSRPDHHHCRLRRRLLGVVK